MHLGGVFRHGCGGGWLYKEAVLLGRLHGGRWFLLWYGCVGVWVMGGGLRIVRVCVEDDSSKAWLGECVVAKVVHGKG